MIRLIGRCKIRFVTSVARVRCVVELAAGVALLTADGKMGAVNLEGCDGMIECGGTPAVNRVAGSAVGIEMAVRMIGIGGALIVSGMAAIAIRGYIAVITVVTVIADRPGMASTQHKRGRMLIGRVIDLRIGPTQVICIVALRTASRKSCRLMIRIIRGLINGQMTGHTFRGKGRVLSGLMAGMAIDAGVNTRERKTRLVVANHHLPGIVPGFRVVALRTGIGELAAMDILVTAEARGGGIAENQIGMTGAAANLRVTSIQRISRFLVIKILRRNNLRPVFRGMAGIAGDLDSTMRLLEGYGIRCGTGRGHIRKACEQEKESQNSIAGMFHFSVPTVVP
jgi:hypothetical protein